MSSIKFTIYLADDSAHGPIPLSPKTFTERIVNDDWGPPIESWHLQIEDDTGKIFELGVDPRDGISGQISVYPAAYDLPDQRNAWIVERARAHAVAARNLISKLPEPLRSDTLSKATRLLADE